MAFTTPRTWVVGETVTAAQLNEQIRDNTNALIPFGVTMSTWAPSLAQGTVSSISATATAAYIQVGGWGFAAFYVSSLAAGVTGSALSISVPVDFHPTWVDNFMPVGTGFVSTTTLNQTIPGFSYVSATTNVSFVRQDTVTAAIPSNIGTSPSFAIRSGDILRFQLQYPYAQ